MNYVTMTLARDGRAKDGILPRDCRGSRATFNQTRQQRARCLLRSCRARFPPYSLAAAAAHAWNIHEMRRVAASTLRAACGIKRAREPPPPRRRVHRFSRFLRFVLLGCRKIRRREYWMCACEFYGGRGMLGVLLRGDCWLAEIRLIETGWSLVNGYDE